MNKKVIEINPTLFKVGVKTNKTKKNRGKETILPKINPSVVKRTLLRRIAQHKTNEINKLKNKNTINNNDEKNKILTDTKEKNDKNNEGLNYSNDNFPKPNLVDLSKEEFNDSINFFQNISKERKKEEADAKIKSAIERKTLKNYNSLNTSPNINLELPEELKVNINTIVPTYVESDMKLKYKVDNEVPYGILKNGIKPTHKEWNKTQKNQNIGLNIEPISQKYANPAFDDREQRLNVLKEKLKQKQQFHQSTNTINNQNIEQPIYPAAQVKIQSAPMIINPIHIAPDMSQMIQQHSMIENPIIHQQPIEPIVTQSQIIEPFKQLSESNKQVVEQKNKKIKKIITKKYTLGKKGGSVSILVKDRNTRKKVLDAHKELKNTQINHIKTTLRKRNLIKIGSNAPNDVIRQMYEASSLCGDINNTNIDTLLHNISKEDKEL